MRARSLQNLHPRLKCRKCVANTAAGFTMRLTRNAPIVGHQHSLMPANFRMSEWPVWFGISRATTELYAILSMPRLWLPGGDTLALAHALYPTGVLERCWEVEKKSKVELVKAFRARRPEWMRSKAGVDPERCRGQHLGNTAVSS